MTEPTPADKADALDRLTQSRKNRRSKRQANTLPTRHPRPSSNTPEPADTPAPAPDRAEEPDVSRLAEEKRPVAAALEEAAAPSPAQDTPAPAVAEPPVPAPVAVSPQPAAPVSPTPSASGRPDAVRARRTPSIEVYLPDDELTEWINQVEDEGFAARQRAILSPVVRLALNRLRAEMTPEEVVKEVLRNAPPPTGRRGRPRL